MIDNCKNRTISVLLFPDIEEQEWHEKDNYYIVVHNHILSVQLSSQPHNPFTGKYWSRCYFRKQTYHYLWLFSGYGLVTKMNLNKKVLYTHTRTAMEGNLHYIQLKGTVFVSYLNVENFIATIKRQCYKKEETVKPYLISKDLFCYTLWVG